MSEKKNNAPEKTPVSDETTSVETPFVVMGELLLRALERSGVVVDDDDRTLVAGTMEMATNNGDRTEEIPDDAVADHIGPVEAYRHRLTVAVNNHRHHIAGAQIHPQPQRRFRRGGRLVTQRCRRLQTWGEPLFVVRHLLLLKQCETHRLIHSDADGQTYARWLPLHRLAW